MEGRSRGQAGGWDSGEEGRRPGYIMGDKVTQFTICQAVFCMCFQIILLQINRESIDAVKNYFREDLQKSDWQLMIELKKLFQII